MKPIFLISLPRSGSTMLQRILMSHPAIASQSEPWIMLPLIYMLKPDGMVTEYRHRDAYRALQDFIKTFPNSINDYNDSLRQFVYSLYNKQCTKDQFYFLDKTPRYYLIIDELAKLFPEAKFIFLVRNPIQTVASIISTFSNNNLKNLHFYHVDLFKGIDKVAHGISSLSGRSLVIKYEQLVSQKTTTLERIFEYLSLDWSLSMVDTLDDRGLSGRMGDQIGTYAYQEIDETSLQKWKAILQERTRKRLVKNIILSLHSDTLQTYGYEKEVLLNELQSLKARTTLRSLIDVRHLISSSLIKRFHLNLHRRRVRVWSRNIVID